jgi:hypothetical protein
MSLPLPWAALRREGAVNMPLNRTLLHARYGRGMRGQNYTLDEWLSLDRSVKDALWLFWVPVRKTYPQCGMAIRRGILNGIVRAWRRTHPSAEGPVVQAAEAWLHAGQIPAPLLALSWVYQVDRVHRIATSDDILYDVHELLAVCERAGGVNEQDHQMADLRDLATTLEG